MKKTDKITNPNISLKPSFPIVGIGASAGGLAAFEAFFAALPTDTKSDMAFVLVQHLAPDHKSILSELIRRYTKMQVFEVEDGMIVKPNCTYIIPPNRDMALLNGILQLIEPFAESASYFSSVSSVMVFEGVVIELQPVKISSNIRHIILINILFL